jgi:diguanylate cyclase (GGDEF)-like protein/PAS domain S-box-containing protein
LQERLTFVLEAAAMGYWDLDLVKNRTTRSLRHDQCFGYDEMLPEWTYETFLAHVHPADREQVSTCFEQAMAGTGRYDVEFCAVWPDGTERWLVSRGHFLRGPTGEALRVGGVVGDVTARKRSEQAAAAVSSRLAGLVESMGDAVVTHTLDGVVQTWNPAAAEMFGWTAQEAIGRSLDKLVPSEGATPFLERMSAVSSGRILTGLGARRRRRDGELLELALTISPVRGPGGPVVGCTSVIREVTQQRRLERELVRQALHDGLTGLPNRALLADRLQHALATAQSSGRPVAVLVMDLDGFKVVNDAAGHAVGDLLLIEVAARLRRAVRPEDTVARSGGDEFVIVCEDADAHAALEVAARIHAALSMAMELEGRRVFIGASIGVAVSPPLTTDQLLRSADVAMYEAKSSGRSRSSLFMAQMAEQAQDRLDLATDLREAFDRGGLQVHYQPVVDVRTGALDGVEALVRWEHPLRGSVPPSVFVAVAEAAGLVTSLDRWVMQRACADGAAMVANGLLAHGAHVAVNVGARDIADGSVGQMVTEAVMAAGPGFDYGRLVVEVTETGLLGDTDVANKALRELCDLGVTIALDDFGTGYSSLSHLQRLPITVLKIDLSFVQRVAENAGDATIVRSIVQLASAMNMRTVAEGVETREQVRLLRDMGCAAGQGWFWGKAMSLQALAELLRSQPDGRFDVD